MRNLYEAVASNLPDVTGAQVEAAIGATAAGSPSDSFWAAWDYEVARIREVFLSVKDEPVVRERMANVT